MVCFGLKIELNNDGSVPRVSIMSFTCDLQAEVLKQFFFNWCVFIQRVLTGEKIKTAFWESLRACSS